MIIALFSGLIIKFINYRACAHEYERQQEMAAAALAYKCMEVAYMKVVYCKNTGTNRLWHDLQTSLQIVPQDVLRCLRCSMFNVPHDLQMHVQCSKMSDVASLLYSLNHVALFVVSSC